MCPQISIDVISIEPKPMANCETSSVWISDANDDTNS